MEKHHEKDTTEGITKCFYCLDVCPVDYGYCHCGCGNQTRIAQGKRHRASEPPRGIPYQYFGRHREQKLSDAQVRDVRLRILDGQRVIDIAAHYKVSKSLISKIGTLTERRDAGI